MEVAIPGSNNGGTPFQREVREWQRLDPNTGALLTGRLEADRWINGSLNSYGKVVDSQNVSQPNGTQHSQRKQLEVLQARTSSGSMQVIRAHTVQTTSSRWTATSSSSASSSNSSSPALMSSSLSGGNASTTTGSGYFPSSSTRFHTNLGVKNDNSATDCSTNGGLMVDEDHLALSSSSNLHMNLHAKLQQQHQHLLSTAPSLKLSNLMKSTPSITNGISSLNNSGSQNKAILHRSNNNNNTNNSPSATAAAGTFNRPQQRHQHSFLTSSSSRQQQQNNDSTATAATTASALLQQASSTSSMSSTSTIAPTISSRQITTTSSGSFCYDSSRYDLPTIMTDTYVGGSSVGSGRIIDICSRDLDDDDDDVVGDGNNNDRLHSSSSLSSSSLLLSNRQNQRETSWQPSSSVTLQRGRSISTDDLSTKNVNSDGVGGSSNGIGGSGFGDGDEDYDEPAEWRRVSKIRRSFQFPSTTASESTRPRPADLPASSVSVSKIREELENGRRLSTAMRNNHLDLVALDNILNGGGGQSGGTLSPLTARKKTASFLTAESLKEIRGKLKKLSDESLYKDDFVTKLEAEREDSPEKVAPNVDADTFQYKPRSNGTVHTTNSLESRSVKYKDTSSAEWHLRRKSYGFEKMSPPDDKSMFRFENSTDSGLGRSSDLGNWSPTTDSGNSSAAARATVITFGEQSKQQQTSSESKVRPMVQRRLRNRTQPQSEAESAEMKRHSIAVDESQYVRENLRKTSAVHLNGFYSKDSSPLNSGFSDDNSRRQKRVEFCKTEVHFAAESGRVNIVETDGKPPPSNNFRRRRRSSSSSSSSSSTISSSTVSSSSMDSMSKNGLPVIHFGDERKATYDSGNLEIGDDDVIDDKKNVTVSIPISLDRNFDSESRDGDEHQDEISIRGILKNKPPKPKPYHLGENIESSDALWGVQLKPVAGSRGFSGERDQTEEDFKEATVSSSVSKSVAERVRIVEERKEGIGYSTKINLNLSNSPYEWTDTSGTLKTYYDEQLQKDFYGTSGVSNLSSSNKHSPQLTEESLKSTPLIIKTLRSANQFDEAMRRLSISSNTSSGAETAIASVTTKHVSSLSHITKAGNASSLNGGVGVGGDFKTNSSEINNSSYSYHHQHHHRSEKLESSSTTMTTKPIAAPRLKVVGSNTNSVSHQLSQLRRMYDYAGLDSDDSARADEEVKGYFVGDLDEDEEDENGDYDCGFEATELSGSWSRVKAKRNELKIQTAKKIHQEVPQSNIMNIELHSPLTPTIKKPELIRMQAPVAKPRTSTAAVKQNTIHKQIEVQQQSHQHHQTTTKSVNQVAPQIHHHQTTTTPTTDPNENLKIVKEARGARRLRDHELSYFGIKMGSSCETNTSSDTRSINKPKLTNNNTISKRSLPSSRKLPSAAKATTRTMEERSSSSSKWSLPSDKPDLLRHSPILVEPHVITKTAIVAPSMGKQQRQRSKSPIYSSDDQTDGIYENIKQPYCRQKDLERDEMNLDEMNKSADQTMKAVSDEAAQKDLRRRSISRRSSKPLETIDEKFSKSLNKTATRTKTTTTTGHRLVRECSNRQSSASSDGESLPTTPMAQRSRSKSRENVEYANLKSKSISSRPIKHRSSSGESRRSVTSSTEDIAHQPRITKSVKRSSTKDEPLLVRHHRHSQPSSSQQRSLRSSTESHDRHKVTPRSSTRDRVESHDQPSQQQQHTSSRSHRSSHAATKSDVEPIKRSSHSSTVDSKSSTKTSRSRATTENEKPSKSSTERVSRSKVHSSQSESVRPHHRSLGSKTATMSSSGGNNSDTLIQSKNATRSTHSSSLKTAATTKRSSKDRK